jgi:stage III sporulation protein SpoIIIAA
VQEAEVIRGIAQRGIAMLGTAHGTNLLSIMRNKELVTLVGGMQVRQAATRVRQVTYNCFPLMSLALVSFKEACLAGS